MIYLPFYQHKTLYLTPTLPPPAFTPVSGFSNPFPPRSATIEKWPIKVTFWKISSPWRWCSWCGARSPLPLRRINHSKTHIINRYNNQDAVRPTSAFIDLWHLVERDALNANGAGRTRGRRASLPLLDFGGFCILFGTLSAYRVLDRMTTWLTLYYDFNGRYGCVLSVYWIYKHREDVHL